MGNNNKDKKLIQDVLGHHSKMSAELQWVTRAAIARQLKAPSGGLNSNRIAALNELVQAGIVEQRQQPHTGKQTLEFRLKG